MVGHGAVRLHANPFPIGRPQHLYGVPLEIRIDTDGIAVRLYRRKAVQKIHILHLKLHRILHGAFLIADRNHSCPRHMPGLADGHFRPFLPNCRHFLRHKLVNLVQIL